MLSGFPIHGTVAAMNRKTILLVAILLCAGCVPHSAPTAPPSPSAPTTIGPETDFPNLDLGEGLFVRQIRADVFVVTHAFPWPANSLIVEMENSELVLGGTPYTPEAEESVLEWIRGRFGDRRITAINPGYHVDNLGGNAALLSQGIPVYGSDRTAELLEERGESTRAMLLSMLQGPGNERFFQAHAKIPYKAPDHLFPIEEGLILSFGSERLEVFYPGPTQAPDKVVVYFPSKRVLFGSCMILGGDTVGNIQEADLEYWPKAIEKLKRFDVDFVVPGHGNRLDPGLIEHTIEVLTAS
jgi:metallo-beta-lactamase class B